MYGVKKNCIKKSILENLAQLHLQTGRTSKTLHQVKRKEISLHFWVGEKLNNKVRNKNEKTYHFRCINTVVVIHTCYIV